MDCGKRDVDVDVRSDDDETETECMMKYDDNYWCASTNVELQD